MQLVRYIEPKNVMLVHGEAKKMEFLKGQIKLHYNLDSYSPPNGKTEIITCPPSMSIDLSLHVLAKKLAEKSAIAVQSKKPCLQNDISVQGVLVCKDNGSMQLLDQSQACTEYGIVDHEMKFQHIIVCDIGPSVTLNHCVDIVYNLVCHSMSKFRVQRLGNTISIGFSTVSFTLYENDSPKHNLSCSIEVAWSFQDDEIANYFIGQLKLNETQFLKPFVEEFPVAKPLPTFSS